MKKPSAMINDFCLSTLKTLLTVTVTFRENWHHKNNRIILNCTNLPLSSFQVLLEIIEVLFCSITFVIGKRIPLVSEVVGSSPKGLLEEMEQYKLPTDLSNPNNISKYNLSF